MLSHEERTACAEIPSVLPLLLVHASPPCPRSRTRARRCCRASTRGARPTPASPKQIWAFAEVGYQEEKSSALLQQQLRAAGFQVTARRRRHPDGVCRDLGIRQAGHRHRRRVRRAARVVAGGAERPRGTPIEDNAPGHGCGHNLLGTGALAAAVAVKDWLARHAPGRHDPLLRHAGRRRRVGQGLHDSRGAVQRRGRRRVVASRRSQRGQPDELHRERHRQVPLPRRRGARRGRARPRPLRARRRSKR